MNHTAQFRGGLASGVCAGQPVEGGSIAEQDSQLPRSQGEGKRDRNAEILSVSSEWPEGCFNHHRIARVSRRLRCLRSLQLNAAPPGKRIDLQIDALNITQARRIAIDGLKALPHGKRCPHGGG